MAQDLWGERYGSVNDFRTLFLDIAYLQLLHIFPADLPCPQPEFEISAQSLGHCAVSPKLVNL